MQILRRRRKLPAIAKPNKTLRNYQDFMNDVRASNLLQSIETVRYDNRQERIVVLVGETIQIEVYPTQDRPDKLDRIEATLDRVVQQLDNQVVVNAELRQSTTDLRASSEALLETANLHQQGLEILAHEMREQRVELQEMRTDINQLQESQRTANVALDRISAILDYLVRQQSNGNG